MKRYLSILAAILIAGCAKQPGAARLTERPGASDGLTKIAISGTRFLQYDTMGLFFCEHEDVPGDSYAAACSSLQFKEHNIGYNNVLVTKGAGADEWSFYNTILGRNVPYFFITGNDSHTMVDVFAYAPHVEGIEKPTEIPFEADYNRDLMYAVQNAGGTNKNLDPDVLNSGDLSMFFKHSLSCINLIMRTKYNVNGSSDHHVDYVTIRKAGAKTTPLFVKGTFNAITGTYSDLEEGDSLRVSSFFRRNVNNYFTGSEGKAFPVMIYPVDFAADGDLEIVLGIDGFRKVFPINKNELKHDDGFTYGFRRGVSYAFNFTVENYVHFDGATVEQEWPIMQIDNTI